MTDWSIQKKVTTLLVSLMLLVVINIIGMFEIAKTGYFTFLEREHLVGVETVKLGLDRLENPQNQLKINTITDSENANYREQGISQGLLHAKLQAEKCLEAVNFAEEALFRMLGFGEAIDICKNDIIKNDEMLLLTSKLTSNALSVDEYLIQSKSAVDSLTFNSDRFAIIIPEIRSFMFNAILLTSVIFSLLLLAAFILVLRKMRIGLQSLCHDMEIIEGDNRLNHEIKIDSKDEIGNVGSSFSKLLKKITSIIENILHSNKTLTEESIRLKGLAKQSNSSAESQLEISSQVSEAIAHMSEAIREVASNINQVASNVEDVNKTSQKGQGVVSLAIDELGNLVTDITEASCAVDELAESGKQVRSVLDVIIQIAEQTNLLALNASIEAARAGEHVRGFAVVSDEVRTLATRTQQSTKEINQIISTFEIVSENAVAAMKKSQTQAEETMLTANNAGEALNEITELSQQITEYTNQVAVAAEEQNQVMNDISHNVSTLGESVKNAKEISSQTNQTASVLGKNVETMNKIVSVFKL
jgi:methyl-accepting chemotaxis protein